MKKEKGIDDIFKNALRDPVNEPAFRESDWDNFDNMLDKEKRGGRVFWLPILSSAAAILLVFFGWWMFKPKGENTAQNAQQVAAHKVNTKDSATAVKQQQIAANGKPEANTSTTNVKPANTTAIEKTTTQQTNVQPQYAAGVNHANKKITLGHEVLLNTAPVNNNQAAVDTARPYLAMIPATINSVIIDQAPATGTGTPTGQPRTGINAVAVATPKPAIKTQVSGGWHPQYALSVLAAPEVNGVGSFNSTSSGTNIGLLFTVGINKFSASTGATYSTKPYSMPFSSYHTAYQFKTDPQSVSADCRVLDIPINVGYQLYNKSRNKFTVGTGISSYVMLHESYAYDYGDAAYPGPASYAVKGKGKYFFSIMNLQASYERKVAPNVGLSLTPYLKLPLSDIGYSQVRIQTFGVAVGLNWNINSLTKPK